MRPDERQRAWLRLTAGRMGRVVESSSRAAPRIEPGGNIAMKVPVGLFGTTVGFYRDVVGLE